MKKSPNALQSFFVTIILVVFACVSGVFLIVALNSKKAIDLELESRGRAIVESLVLARNWNAGYGGILVEKSEGVISNPYLKDPDVAALDGRIYTKKNPALMVRELSELAERDGRIAFKITSHASVNPVNAPDPFEQEALRRFERGKKEVSGREIVEGSTYFRYVAPLAIEASCLNCHDRGYKIGDIHGGISVRFNIDAVEAALVHKMYLVLGLALTTFVSLFGIIYRLVARLRRRLKEAEERLLQEKREIESAQLQLQGAYADLKRTQEQMFQQEKMASIGVLAAGVAHEINNPIGFIASNLDSLGKYCQRMCEFVSVQERLVREGADPRRVSEMEGLRRALKIDYIRGDMGSLIRESREGVDRVAKIVQDLKSFARNDDTGASAVDLNDCLESAVNILRNEIKYKATLEKDLRPLPPVQGYRHQLWQVFINLLLNAAQAIEGKGAIRIRSFTEGERVAVAVSDSGCGIDPEVLSKIFEPFFTTKEVGQGTGLGLSICYQIVQQHGGEIEVDSAPGEGTTFVVKLPRSGLVHPEPAQA